jgi:hypothetical protein
MMETVSTSVTSVNVYQPTRRNVLEDSHLHTCRRENLKSRPAKYGMQSFKNKLIFDTAQISNPITVRVNDSAAEKKYIT